jgi:hypothetical protein
MNRKKDRAGVKGIPDCIINPKSARQMINEAVNYPREDKCKVCGAHIGWIMNEAGEPFALETCDEHRPTVCSVDLRDDLVADDSGSMLYTRGHLPERDDSLTRQEVATILAALRLWQETSNRDEEWMHQVATIDGSVEALNEEEIDELCEKLNDYLLPSEEWEVHGPKKK